ERLVVEQQPGVDVPVGRDDRLVLLQLVEPAGDLADGGIGGQEAVGMRHVGVVAHGLILARPREGCRTLSSVAGGRRHLPASRGPVVPRGTRRTGSVPSTGLRCAEGFSMRRTRRSTAARPWARFGLTTVVSPPPTRRES